MRIETKNFALPRKGTKKPVRNFLAGFNSLLSVLLLCVSYSGVSSSGVSSSSVGAVNSSAINLN